MALITLEDFYYFYGKTGEEYYKQRALDTYAWAMNIMELYPSVTGYGCYGVLTERYCPSDGLVTDTNKEGQLASIWHSYNGWAAANVLEGILQQMEWEEQI